MGRSGSGGGTRQQPNASELNTRKRAWFEMGMTATLTELNSLPTHNINKPNSPYFSTLLRLASLTKGGGYKSDDILNQIKYHGRQLNLSPKDIEYQWNRAMNKASAREFPHNR